MHALGVVGPRPCGGVSPVGAFRWGAAQRREDAGVLHRGSCFVRDACPSPPLTTVVATRAASGGEAASSSSSPASPQKQIIKGAGREQKPGFSQNKAIKLLGDMEDNPWSVNTYHSKRATHKVNARDYPI